MVVFFTGGSFRKVVRVPLGVPRGGGDGGGGEADRQGIGESIVPFTSFSRFGYSPPKEEQSPLFELHNSCRCL